MSDVGEIVGRLRLDTSAWFAELDRAEAKAQELSGVDPKVTVKTEGTARAVTELEAVRKAEDRVSDSTTAATRAQARSQDALGRVTKGASAAAGAEDALDRSSQKAARSSSAFAGEARKQADALAVLVKVGIAAAPALVPVAAATVGLAAGFGGLAAAGLLAGTGVARGLKDGSAAAQGYRPLIAQLLADVHELQDTAETGLLPGAEDAVGRLQAKMPTLRRETATFAAQLADMTPTAVDAIVTALERAEPLLDAGGNMLVKWVHALDDGAHSDEFRDFIQYALNNLPETEQLLADALKLAGDFLRTMGPYADTALHVADGLVQVGDALVPIAPAIWASWTAFQAWKGAGAIIDLLRGKLTLLGAEAVATSGKVGAAGASGSAGGVLGAGAGAVAGLVGLGAYAVGDVANTGSKMLGVTSSGAGSSQAAAQRQIAQLIATAQVAGGGVKGVAQTPSWIRDLQNGAAGDLFSAGGGYAGTQASRNANALDGTFAKMVSSGNASKAAAMVRQFAAATHLSTTETAALLPQYTAAAAAYGKVGGAAGTAAPKLDRLAQAWQVTSGAINLSTDAAVANEQSLDAAGDAVAAFGTQVASAAKATKSGTTSLSANTAAGRANREALTGALVAINQHAASINADGKHAQQATAYTYSQIAALKEQASKAGISKGAVDDLVAALTHIPKSVVSKITASTADALAKVAAVRAKMVSLNGLTSDVYVNLVASGVSSSVASRINRNAGQAHGGTVMPDVPGHADGGTVRGPGTAATDSVLRRLSVGEEVTSNLRGQAAANRPMLKAINTGDAGRIRRTAQDQYGVQAQTVNVTTHFTDDGSYVGGIARQAAEKAVADYEAAAYRSARGGYRPKGLLTGTGS